MDSTIKLNQPDKFELVLRLNISQLLFGLFLIRIILLIFFHKKKSLLHSIMSFQSSKEHYLQPKNLLGVIAGPLLLARVSFHPRNPNPSTSCFSPTNQCQDIIARPR